MQEHSEIVDWLMEHGGPIIRYRTALELQGESDIGRIDSLRKELLSEGLVRTWLGNLRPSFGPNDLHHSKPEAYENAMGKLYEFGLRRGVKALDKRTEPFRRWLAGQLGLSEGERAKLFFPVFYWTLVAAFLSMTGYSDDEAVYHVIRHRLEQVYPFARRGDLSDVYVPQDSFPGFPKAFRGKPLINPELIPGGEMALPSIHDVNAFLHSEPVMEDPALRRKVETVAGLILKPEYQELPEGYGVIRDERNGRYYAAGWSVHLPGFLGQNVQAKDFGRLLLRMSVLSRSRTAREHPWFERSLQILQGYRTDEGLIRFPGVFMPKSETGYWVWGRRMGLEPGRRTKETLASESIFRYLEITKRSAPSH